MMRTTRYLFFFLLLSMILTGCNTWENQSWERQGEEGKWSVEIPAFFVSATDLNANAPLQERSPDRDFFLIIRHDPLSRLQKEQPQFTLEDFLDLSIERLLVEIINPKVPEAGPHTIGSLEAHQAIITGQFNGQAVFYKIAVVKGKKNLYQILAWTSAEKAEKLGPYMDRIIDSFKEE